MRLTGKQVVLRRLSPDDLTAFQAYRSDPEVARFQGWSAMSDNTAAAFLAEMAAVPLLQPGRWTQIAIANTRDHLIGDLGLFLSDDQIETEIGITLSLDAQGRGYAQEAVAMAMRLVFAETPVVRIAMWTDRRNLAAQRLIRRAGLHWVLEEAGTDRDGAAILEDRFEALRPEAGC